MTPCRPDLLLMPPPPVFDFRARTLADHRALMHQPEWWDTLNYESEAISRFDLAQAAIEAEARVTRARADLLDGALRHMVSCTIPMRLQQRRSAAALDPTARAVR